MMKKIGFGLLVLVVLFVGFSACARKVQSSANDQSKLIGKWTLVDTDSWRFEFTSNSLTINGGNAQNVEYKIENGAIKMTWLGSVYIIADSFEFVDNDTLKLVGGNAEGTYKRVK